MFKSTLSCAAILAFALAGPAAAQRLELISIPQAADRPVSGSIDSDVALLRSAADWISHVFSLPHLHDLPAVQRFTAGKSAFLSSTGTASDRLPANPVMNYQRTGHEMVAQYDYAARTIYLPNGWNGSTPAEMSALVHAMAHHFQNVGGWKQFNCPEERAALPYEAQAAWLGLYDRSLSEDFGIDQATLMLVTQCMP